MSLIDPRESRLTISPQWSPTVEEIARLFEESGRSKVIEDLLETDSIQDYFQYHLIENFRTYTTPKESLPKQVKEDIAWLLNEDALRRDVTVNAEIRVLQLQASADVEAASKRLEKDLLEDIIFDLEESLDDVFGVASKNACYILTKRLEDKKETNVFRRWVVLIG